VYASAQGFLKYNFISNEAVAPFAKHTGIEKLYALIQQQTNENITIVNKNFSVTQLVQKFSRAAAKDNAGSISSFYPSTVNAGTLNAADSNLLTINGSGFGDNPSGSSAVLFKNGNQSDATPSYEVPYNSSYVVSWTDTKIVLHVPTQAATGKIAVVTGDGSSFTSDATLNVFYSVLNFGFIFTNPDTSVATEPRLMNANNAGGYTYQFSTSTAGQGINFATSNAASTFERAMTTWKNFTGVNFINGNNTSTQLVKDDNINVIEFDNKNTGVPAMAAGVLEVTYSWGSVCYNSSPFKIYTAQKTGFDILIRNNNVSNGNTAIEDGPCFPANNAYDLESIILHEIGHALNLSHIADTYEGNAIPNINPGKIMNYAIVNYVVRRSLDISAYAGALYCVHAAHYNYSNCGLVAEMTQNTFSQAANDECAAAFPAQTIAANAAVNFDLTKTSSNKFTDPSFTQTDCNGNGFSVTNNAYYAFKTGAAGGNLHLAVSGYSPTPDNFNRL